MAVGLEDGEVDDEEDGGYNFFFFFSRLFIFGLW